MIDVSMLHPFEGFLVGVGLTYEKAKKYPIKCRTTYQIMTFFLMRDSRYVDLFEDENGTFLMVVTPVGRVQVYSDRDLQAGEAFFEFRDNSPEPMKVQFAY